MGHFPPYSRRCDRLQYQDKAHLFTQAIRFHLLLFLIIFIELYETSLTLSVT